jgi:hypothetical protein
LRGLPRAALPARIPTSGRRLHSVATLAGGGRLVSALAALLPGAAVLVGRLLLHPVATLARRGRLVSALAALLPSAPVLSGRLLRCIAALARRGRRASPLVALLSRQVRHAERSDGPAVNSPAGLEALLPLECNQRLRCARTQHAVRLAREEPFLLQDDLHLPDFIRAETQYGDIALRWRSAPGAVETRGASTGRAHRYDAHNLAAAIDNHDLVAHDEVLVSAPLRIDLDERGGSFDDAHPRGHRCPDAKREVDVVDARDVAAGKDRLLNPGALLRGQRHVAASLTLLSLTLLSLTLLSLTLLSLTLLSLTLLSLTLLSLALLRLALLSLTRLGLTLLSLTLLVLLALRRRSLGLIALPALVLGRALALIALSLTRGLVTLSLTALLGLALLALAWHALVPLALLALPLHASLVTPALLALFALRSLTCGLVPLLLPPAALGLTLLVLILLLILRSLLLALVLRSLLCLAAAALLAVLPGSTALGLSGASRLSAARHILG